MEEVLICELRRHLGLSLNDIVEVMQRCADAQLSRSVIYRCLPSWSLWPRDAADYLAADIEVLTGLEPVRRRPGGHLGGLSS